ncbi:MAG: ribosome biogenesis GTPase Der, partial [Rhodanobacteraceae bacterium]
GGDHPPNIVVHGTRTRHIAPDYRRYLENFFRRRYKLEGTPVRVEFREGENPYAGKPRAPAASRKRNHGRPRLGKRGR